MTSFDFEVILLVMATQINRAKRTGINSKTVKSLNIGEFHISLAIYIDPSGQSNMLHNLVGILFSLVYPHCQILMHICDQLGVPFNDKKTV
jgi:hypothetical protein